MKTDWVYTPISHIFSIHFTNYHLALVSNEKTEQWQTNDAHIITEIGS